MKTVIVSKNKPIFTVEQKVNKKKSVVSLFMKSSHPEKYRWIRSDGMPVSPEFPTIHVAELYQKHIPLLTDHEWTGTDLVRKLKK